MSEARKFKKRALLERMAGLGLAAIAPVIQASESVKPNIVWIFSDDHAGQAIGAYGGRFHGENLTPHIDTLARDGMLFMESHVANSICCPSRATLLTGKHSHINGTRNNSGSFDHDQPQFQKVLREHGYRTAMIGKIHLKGRLQGFDYWEVLPGQGEYRDPVFVTEAGQIRYEGRHSTDVITDRALEWLDEGRDADRPFMLMVHYKAPHRPWVPTERWALKFKDRTFAEPASLFESQRGRGTAAREQRMTIAGYMDLQRDLKSHQPERRQELEALDPGDSNAVTRLKYQWYMRDYLACVAGVDESVGRILDYLNEKGLSTNTVVMYSSDQGFYLGENGWFDKRFMYRESFRTPLLVRWPGVVQPGSRNADLVQNIDWAPTFLDIAGAVVPEDIQGRSLVPLMKGQAPGDWRTALYYHYYESGGGHNVPRHEGVYNGKYKLIRFYGPGIPGGEEWEFYDVDADPSDLNSVYRRIDYQDTIQEMKTELQRLREHYRVP
jgi:arylsulfatase A-like enzyme